MTIILFLIDTSGSMNQRTHYGARPTLLDVTKETVEKFIKMRQRDVASRGDRYMLLTFDDVPYNIKAGWKENHSVFMNELKNLTATGMTTFGPALKNAFDYLNINRMQTGIDTYGLGRCPYYLEAAIIIAITDGGRYSTTTNVVHDLNLPMSSPAPGAEFTCEPFRWDQRLFSIVLRLSGTYTADPPSNGSNNFVVPCDDSALNLMCEVTGGRSFCVTSQKALTASLEQLIARMHIGVMIKFEKHIGSDPVPIIPNEEEMIELNNRNWHSTRSLIYVRSGQKGYSVGHWPIPEAYWPDVNIPNLQPRTAHPLVKFTCVNSDPFVIDNLPFDKYELDPSPLTQFILSRKQPNVAWQVYVPNSQRGTELGQPFGYLKASTNLSCVNLFVLPYNYPVLLPLLDEFFKVHQGKPTREWRIQFENYLKTMPVYYAQPLRRALQRMGATAAMVPENLDVYTSVTVNNLVKKHKGQAKLEFEKLANSVGTQKPIGVEWPRISSSQLSSNFNRKSGLLDYCSNPSLRKVFVNLQNEHQDFGGFVVRYKDKPNSDSKIHYYRNPFDIARHDLIDQLYKLRRNFFQKQTSSIKYQDEDQLHSLPVSQMGNYQEYLKRMPIPLREIEAVPTRQHMFGNPFKLDKKNMMMIDEADIDLVGGNGGTGGGGNTIRGKRPLPEQFSKGGSMPKRKQGPLPRDFAYLRPAPPTSPSPPASPPIFGAMPPAHPSFSTPMTYPNPNSSSHYAPFPPNNIISNSPNAFGTIKFPAQSNGHFVGKPAKVPAAPFTNSGSIPQMLPQMPSTNNNKLYEMNDISTMANSNHFGASSANRAQPMINNNKKLQPAMTNGIISQNKLAKGQGTDSEQNGFEDLSAYLLNFYRRKNFSSDEYEKKFHALKLVRKQSKDYNELLQYLGTMEGSFAQYLLLEVVLEAIRFKKKSVIHSLQSHSHFGPKMEKILLANNLTEDGQPRPMKVTK